MARTIRCDVHVDGRPCATLTIENALTGTDGQPNYRVTVIDLAEPGRLVAEVKNFDRRGKTRSHLIAAAFAAIAEQEVPDATP